MKQFSVIAICLSIALSFGLSISHADQYDPIVYQAQQILKSRGYDLGTPDGMWGKATERAVKYFQVDNDLPVTGKLDAETKTKLGLGAVSRAMEAVDNSRERRTALVIGNGDYRNISPLRNPVNDARDIAAALKHLGFEVLHMENADQRSMERVVVQFSRSLRKGGVGLFYYAGHGVQVNGRNYLIPVGVEINTEFDVKYEAVDMGRVLDGMYDAGNGLNIVMLDACRNNPFVRSFRTADRGLARMDAPTGTFIAYATAPGSVAADGDGRNGIFTKHLLKNMKSPGLSIERVLKLTRNEVMAETGNKQVPWQASSLTGDFYFVSAGAGLSQAAGTPSEREAMVELSDERAKLERERRELERLKLEIEKEKMVAERRRLEAEKQKMASAGKSEKADKSTPKVAAIDPKDREIGRDGQYIAYDNGVVYDTKTGLEWMAGPDRDTTWEQATRWVESLTEAGGGWRMPTIKELETLYIKNSGIRNMTPLLKVNKWYVWSGDYRDNKSAWCFNFYYGSRDYGSIENNLSKNRFSPDYWYNPVISSNSNAIAVRSRR